MNELVAGPPNFLGLRRRRTLPLFVRVVGRHGHCGRALSARRCRAAQTRPVRRTGALRAHKKLLQCTEIVSLADRRCASDRGVPRARRAARNGHARTKMRVRVSGAPALRVPDFAVCFYHLRSKLGEWRCGASALAARVPPAPSDRVVVADVRHVALERRCVWSRAQLQFKCSAMRRCGAAVATAPWAWRALYGAAIAAAAVLRLLAVSLFGARICFSLVAHDLFRSQTDRAARRAGVAEAGRPLPLAHARARPSWSVGPRAAHDRALRARQWCVYLHSIVPKF